MQTAENLDNKIKELWPKNGPSILEVEKYIKKYFKHATKGCRSRDCRINEP